MKSMVASCVKSVFILLLTSSLAAPAGAQLGGLGNKVKKAKDVAQAFSIDAEKELEMGRAAHPHLVARMGGLSDDAKLKAYVSRVGARLAGEAARDEVEYQFFVVDDPMVNAFAMPGGFVYVTTGMLRFLDDEAELAAVLGHEIAHVEERHGVERMRKAVLAELGADHAASKASGTVGPEIAHLVANLFADLALSGYGRGQELESDEVGLALANAAGYDPTGAVRCFERLQELEGGEQAKTFDSFFSSHPPTDKRVKQAEKQIARLGAKGTETNKAQYDAATKALGG